MDFDLTEDQQLIRNTVRDFADRVVAPQAAEIDKTGAFPVDILTQMADLGLMGLPIAEEYGGSGADYTELLPGPGRDHPGMRVHGPDV